MHAGFIVNNQNLPRRPYLGDNGLVSRRVIQEYDVVIGYLGFEEWICSRHAVP
jgi:hypothetical protein